MTIKIGINGWGRIGRLAFRLLEENDNFEVVHINGTRPNDMSAYLLKYDTVHRQFNGEIDFDDEGLIVNNRKVLFTREREPKLIPWKQTEVEYVIDSSGKFTDVESLSGHIEAGASKVFLSAPGSEDIKMLVYGINEDSIEESDNILSAASCTTNCLAPMAKTLNDAFGLQKGLMTTIHAYTSDQNLQDGSHKKFTRSRAAASNIIPTTTGAARSIAKVIPELEGKLDGSAQRVPVIDGSLTELTVTLDKKTSVEEINNAMKAQASESFAYEPFPIVSSDIIGNRYGSVFDATQTAVLDTDNGQMVRTVAWYDNETGFTAQLIRIMEHVKKIN